MKKTTLRNGSFGSEIQDSPTRSKQLMGKLLLLLVLCFALPRDSAAQCLSKMIELMAETSLARAPLAAPREETPVEKTKDRQTASVSPNEQAPLTPLTWERTAPALLLTSRRLGRVSPVAIPIALGSPSQVGPPPPFAQAQALRWRRVFKQSLLFLAIEHSFRLATEQGTRDDLKGPFFKDWFQSVRNLRGWRDGDPFFVNYIGHPMQGAVSGFILIQNDPKGQEQVIGKSKAYWQSRLKAAGWNLLYSTQFELGPLSECSIGNVGLRPTRTSRHPQAYVDLVITPVIGAAWMIGEDALDRYLIRRLETHIQSHAGRTMVRSFLNPARSFANLLGGRWFWHRDGRPGVSHY